MNRLEFGLMWGRVECEPGKMGRVECEPGNVVFSWKGCVFLVG